MEPASAESACETSRALSASSLPPGQAAVRLERRLLAGRAVERTQPPGLQAELEQLLERLRALALHGAVLDRGDQVGQPAAPVFVLHHGEHGRGLGQRDLARLALQRDGLRPPHSWLSPPTIACSSCSKPPVSIAQWMPHSLGAPLSHHQRPARACSPGAIARVQGAQPIDV